MRTVTESLDVTATTPTTVARFMTCQRICPPHRITHQGRWNSRNAQCEAKVADSARLVTVRDEDIVTP